MTQLHHLDAVAPHSPHPHLPTVLVPTYLSRTLRLVVDGVVVDVGLRQARLAPHIAAAAPGARVPQVICMAAAHTHTQTDTDTERKKDHACEAAYTINTYMRGSMPYVATRSDAVVYYMY